MVVHITSEGKSFVTLEALEWFTPRVFGVYVSTEFVTVGALGVAFGTCIFGRWFLFRWW